MRILMMFLKFSQKSVNVITMKDLTTQFLQPRGRPGCCVLFTGAALYALSSVLLISNKF
jgi:hypothetical protein